LKKEVKADQTEEVEANRLKGRKKFEAMEESCREGKSGKNVQWGEKNPEKDQERLGTKK